MSDLLFENIALMLQCLDCDRLPSCCKQTIEEKLILIKGSLLTEILVYTISICKCDLGNIYHEIIDCDF